MHPHVRRLLGPVVVLILLAAALALSTGSASASHGLLDHSRHGRAALSALGDGLDQAANVNRMTSAKLRTILAGDPTAWVGRDGRLFYVEPAEATTTTAAAATTTAAAPYPLDQTFALHSLPGSQHTIYLDFDGYTLGNSFWSNSGGMTAGTFAGFSMDADPAFSDAEKTLIQQVWQIVAEKYAPFDIDVTTQDPGAAAYNRSGAGDPTYGDHVVFSDDPNAINQACAGTCSGIAIVGGFDSTNDNTDQLEPAWVFTSTTYDSPALIAHTAAHEIGHTLGLSHDGVIGGTAYYSGQGNWFPIMGTGVNAIGQFSKGEYPLANNTEDDLAVIAAHGAPLRTDDYGNSIGTAADLGTHSAYSLAGFIGTAADTDVFAVTRDCAGDLTAAANGIGEGQALDLEVTVMNAAGATLTSNDPASDQDGSWPHKPIGMDASATVTGAAAGTYYVKVEGVGKGNPLTGGYSDYDSLGDYHLTVTGCAGAGGSVPAQPDTVTATPTSSSTGTLAWTAPSDNGGATVTGYTITGLPTGTRIVSASTFSSSATGLVPGTTYTVGVAAINSRGTGPARTALLRVPTSAPATAPGAPRIGTASSGARGRPVTATARWAAPLSNGGATITGYRVKAYQLSSTGRLVRVLTTRLLAGSQRSLVDALPAGRYRFRVVAYNRIGASRLSSYSAIVTAR